MEGNGERGEKRDGGRDRGKEMIRKTESVRRGLLEEMPVYPISLQMLLHPSPQLKLRDPPVTLQVF